MTQPATIAILGGGYAGLFAAHRAARAAAKTRHSPVRVVLVDAGDGAADGHDAGACEDAVTASRRGSR